MFHIEKLFLCFLVLNSKHFEAPLCFSGTFSRWLIYLLFLTSLEATFNRGDSNAHGNINGYKIKCK